MTTAYWRPDLIDKAINYVRETYKPLQVGEPADYIGNDKAWSDQIHKGNKQWDEILRLLKRKYNLGVRELTCVFYYVRPDLNYFGWVYRPDLYFAYEDSIENQEKKDL